MDDTIFYKNLFPNMDKDNDSHPSKEALYKTFYYQSKIHENLKHQYTKFPPGPYSYEKDSLEISSIILDNIIDEIEYYPSSNLSKAKKLEDIVLDCIIPNVVYEIQDREHRSNIGLLVVEDESWIRVYYSKNKIQYRASSTSSEIDKSDRIQLKNYIINLFKKFN
jgi:hypothetical protein